MTNLKPFDLEKAKAGEPVLANGKTARIICFNRVDFTGPSLVVLVKTGTSDYEATVNFKLNGESFDENYKLSMAPVKKTGWINIYIQSGITAGGKVYKSENDALINKYHEDIYLDTIKIEWEE